MKKISILFLAFFTMLSFNSCLEDEEPTFIVQEDQATPPTIVTANSTVILSKDAEDNQALTVVWNDAEYNFQTPVTYDILVAVAGTNFENAIDAASTVERSYTWTVKDLNNLAINSGLVIDKEGALEIRIVSSLGSNGGVSMNSNILAITLTPYSTEVPKIWVPGSYAEASGYGSNWNPSDPETPALAAENFTSQSFEGYINFAEGNSNFKFTPTNVDFSGDYGDTGDSDGSYSQTIEQEGEVNCGLPGGVPGYYRVNVDLETLEYKLELTDWAVTGSSTPLGFAPAEAGPDQDHDLTYNKDSKVWSITLDLTPGEIKFRANDSWSLNFGNDDDGDGSLNEEGSNITVETGGTYIISLDLSNPRAYTYSLTPVTN